MSVAASTWAWGVRGLNPTRRLVLLRLADHCDRWHRCWPGVAHLAAICECSESTVERALAWLKRRDLIVAERVRIRGVAGMSSVVYTLAVEARAEGEVPSPYPDAPEAEAADTPATPRNLTGVATPRTGDADTPQTEAPTPRTRDGSIKEEPSENPQGTEHTHRAGAREAGAAASQPVAAPHRPAPEGSALPASYTDTPDPRAPRSRVRTVTKAPAGFSGEELGRLAVLLANRGQPIEAELLPREAQAFLDDRAGKDWHSGDWLREAAKTLAEWRATGQLQHQKEARARQHGGAGAGAAPSRTGLIGTAAQYRRTE